MTLELRILSGLHRGAALPLDDNELVIGASEDADVVLADPGIAERHAVILLTEGGWCLSATDGKVFDAESNRPHSLIDLTPGDCARLDGVWLTVEEQDAPWRNPPPLPQDLPQDMADEVPLAADGDNPIQAETSTELAHTDGSGEAPVMPAVPELRERPERRKGRWLFVPLVLVTVLTAAAAYGITASSSLPEGGTGKLAETRQWTEAVLQGDKGENAAKSATADKPGDAEPPTEKLSAEELRKAFRKRLADAYLLPRFDLDLRDDAWNMQATLDDEEAARFERVLASFVKTYNIRFPVNARVGSAENMLPFKIQQVISGANASVITQDGVRVYIGEEYRGYRLLAIRGSQISFAGKRKVEVIW